MRAVLKELVGQAVNSIELLPDYFQIVFDRARISVLSAATLTDESGQLNVKDPLFATRLWKLVGAQVSAIAGDGQTAEVLQFGERGTLTIPVGPESGTDEPLMFIRPEGQMYIWD